jgi:hypothetical protein
VDVLDGGVGGVVAVELCGVVEVGSPGVSVDAEDVAPVDVVLCVGVVEDPPVVFELLLSEGAVGLTPPPLRAVEVPPVARTLTLTGVVVVTEVEFGASAPDLVDALAESLLATPTGAWVRATSGEGGTVGAGSLDAALAAAVWTNAARGAGATAAGRAWWRW